jgi:hypothetical protein
MQLQESSTPIYPIRHAEKPDAAAKIGGSRCQRQSRRGIPVLAWLAASRRIGLCLAPTGIAGQQLLTPLRIYAAQPPAGGGKGSLRSRQTVTPLAQKLNVTVDLRFGLGDEQSLVEDATAGAGPVLICWQHEGITEIAARIMGTLRAAGIPSQWPGDRFDLVWSILRLGDEWRFTQIPQRLLCGDSDRVLE